jgi:MSHA biogenesis protein MshQ
MRRWQCGIARALLLLGAFAGMTLGTAALAQITFKGSSSATALGAPSAPFASAGATGKITFVGAGAVAASTGAITPALPANIAPDDILLLFLQTNNQAISIPTPNGGTWTEVLNGAQGSPQSTGTALTSGATRLTVFWSRYNGTQGAPTTSDSGDHQLGRMVAFRGVITTGNPWDVTAGGTEASDTSGSIPGAINTVANAFIVAAIATGLPDATGTTNFSAWANGNLANVLEQTDNTTNAGFGGGLGIATGERAAATGTTYGSTAVTLAVAAAKAMISIALKPSLTQLTIDKPSTTSSGRPLFASIGFRPSCCGQLAANYGITPVDAGWTLLRRIDNAPGPVGTGPPSNSLAIYWKIAGASEPAAYRWTFPVTAPTTFDSAAGGILRFFILDVSATNPPVPGVEENGQNTVALAQTTPSITTVATNTMLVTSHSFASGPFSWTGAPPGMTNAVNAQAASQTTGIFYGVQALTGATGPKTATTTPADDDIGNAHILALRYLGFDLQLPIPIPTGTAAGDIMVASIANRAAASTITPPSGWVEVRRTEQTTGTVNSQIFYIRVADASDTPGTSYTWTLGSAVGSVGGILSFSGVDTTAPILSNAIDASGGNLTGSTANGNNTATSINSNVADTVAVSAHSFFASANWTPPPSAAAEDVDLSALRVANAGGISLGMYHYPAQAVPGATGDKTAVASNDFNTGVAQILTLKPVPAPVTTPGDFNAFESSTTPNPGAITGRIFTKLAGTSFSLDVVAIVSGAQQTAFTNTVQVDLVTGSTGGLNCPGTPATIAGTTQSVSVTSGRGTTGSFNVATAYRDVRVRIRYPVASPTVTSCSTDNFSIRPTLFTVTSTNATQTGTSGTPAIKTGANFNLTAASIAGYDGTPSIDNTKVVGTPTAGTLGGSFGAAPVGTGTASGASFFYSEVGNFGLNADAVRDTAFTSVDPSATDCIGSSTSNTLSGGKYGCWVGSNAVAQTTGVSGFGRFIPDNFNVAYTTAPVFGAVCGTFTYVGTRFTYPTAVMTVTARNGTNNGLTNAPTVNYAGAYMKLSNAAGTSLNQAPYNTQGGRYTRFDALGGGATPALDTSGLPATTADPAIGAFSGGSGTLTFGSGTGLAFTRSTTTPSAPFNADIALALNVIDTDAVAFAGNPAAFGTATAGGGVAFSGGKGMRFGRLAIRNANGSQLVALPVPLETQYWNGTAFITNDADNCTTIATNNVAMSNFTNNLAACETANTAVSAFTKGRSTLTLAAPGSGNNGSVDLAVNLSAASSGTTCTTVGGGTVPAAGANRAYLQGNWTGGAYDQNPSARATFGVYKGSDEVIFIRENF